MKKINAHDYAEHIIKELPRGILLNTSADGKDNTMTIGWGLIGIEWERPMFLMAVRKSRYTHEFLQKNKEFTVSIPLPEAEGGIADAKVDEIMGYCGSQSGRDGDKFDVLGLTKVPGQSVTTPAIKELPLTIECKIVFEAEQVVSGLVPEIADAMYPEGGTAGPGAAPHICYFGEIVDAYILD